MFRRVSALLGMIVCCVAVTPVAASGQAECWECYDVRLLDTWFHTHWETSGGIARDDVEANGEICGAERCQWECSKAHNKSCSPELPNSDALAALVATGRPQGLLELILIAPSNLKLNQERHALQVLNCKGLVVLHLPLNDHQFGVLARAINLGAV